MRSALKLAVEPVSQVDFPCSSGFTRSARRADALQVLVDEARRGKDRRWVVKRTSRRVSTLPHNGLMLAVEERTVDRHVLKLIRG